MTVDQMKQQSSEICFNIILFGIQKRIGLSTKCLESSCQSQGFLGISGSLQSGFKMSMHLKLSTIKPAPIPYHLILVCKGVNKRSRFITPSINRSIRASRPLLPAQPLSQNLMCTFDRCCLIPRILSRVLKPLGLSENGMGKPKSNWLIIIPSRLMAIGVKMAIACYSPLLLRICGQLCQPRIQPALASGKVAFLGQLATNLQKGQNQINRLEHGRADTCSRLLPN